MEIITPSASDWDAFIRAQPRAHALQLSAWGTLKSAYGWQSEAVALRHEGQIRAGAQLLYRPLPARLGTMAYLPFGGFVDDPRFWPDLWQAVQQQAARKRAAFLKWEPGFDLPFYEADLQGWGFQPSPQTIQPPRTILLDLADDESMLARMNQGTRRKIRQSLKNGLHYSEASAADVARFTALMQETGARNEFGTHEASYYEMAYRLFVPSGDAALILAQDEEEVLAGVMVFALGDTAWYLYGASSSHKRDKMASYGAQWQAIRWARDRGCHTYDLWGIPDADETTLEAQFQTRSDGLWGVYGFKRGWGGRVARSLGAWDLPLQPLLYAAYRLVLRLRGAR